jgi:hypothetical protein
MSGLPWPLCMAADALDADTVVRLSAPKARKEKEKEKK